MPEIITGTPEEVCNYIRYTYGPDAVHKDYPNACIMLGIIFFSILFIALYYNWKYQKRIKKLNARWKVDCSSIHDFPYEIQDEEELALVFKAAKIKHRAVDCVSWDEAYLLVCGLNDEGCEKVRTRKDVDTALYCIRWYRHIIN